MTDLPGGGIASRPLHFIWILDTSASMSGEKIGALNFAIRESQGPMVETARDNPNAQVLVRVVTFSSGARWHLELATPIDQFVWKDVSAAGVTDAGQALVLVAEQLRMPPMSERALPPVLVLVSDGYPTDNFDRGLKALLDEPWGRRAVRIGIGVGSDTDSSMLEAFIGNPEIPVLQAKNPATLISFMRWASTAVIKATSEPIIRPNDRTFTVPPPPPEQSSNGDADVW
jgi:uncharacterized protein YegL